RVAVEQRAMPVLAQERVEYLVRGNRCTEWQRAASEPLAETDDVRCNPRPLASEQRSGAAEPGEDFVRDEENVVVTRAFSQRGERCFVIHQHAARAHEQRLDYQRGDGAS